MNKIVLVFGETIFKVLLIVECIIIEILVGINVLVLVSEHRHWHIFTINRNQSSGTQARPQIPSNRRNIDKLNDSTYHKTNIHTNFITDTDVNINIYIHYSYQHC